jgi:hypothetical protein
MGYEEIRSYKRGEIRMSTMLSRFPFATMADGDDEDIEEVEDDEIDEDEDEYEDSEDEDDEEN